MKGIIKKILLVMIGVAIIWGISVFYFTRENCEYEVVENGTMGSEIFTENRKLEQMVNKKYVNVKNQQKKISTYNISLQKFFYDSSSGIAAVELKIKNLNGENISAEEYKDLRKKAKNGDITYFFKGVISGSNFLDEVEKTENGEVYIYHATLLSGISEEKDRKKDVQGLSIRMGSEHITFATPEFDAKCEEKVIELAEESKIESLCYGDGYIDVMWNTKQIMKDFKKSVSKKKKELRQNFNEENYGYDVYQLAQILTKQGEKIDIDVVDKKNIQACFFMDQADKKKANLRVVLDDEIEIAEIIIDGEVYKIDS